MVPSSFGAGIFKSYLYFTEYLMPQFCQKPLKIGRIKIQQWSLSRRRTVISKVSLYHLSKCGLEECYQCQICPCSCCWWQFRSHSWCYLATINRKLLSVFTNLLTNMVLKTNHFKSHVREHTVEPLLKQRLMSQLCWGQQGPRCWVGEQHPSKDLFLVRGGCLLPITVRLVKGDENRWELSSGFQSHPSTRKIWRENEQWYLWGVGHQKRTYCAQFVGICVCMGREMQAEVIISQWFSTGISKKLPLPVSNFPLHRPVLPGLQRWVLKGWKIDGFVCIYALFSLI